MFFDLEEDIADIFAEAQGYATAPETLCAGYLEHRNHAVRLAAAGFSISQPSTRKEPTRTNRARAARTREARIEAALLAGERPKGTRRAPTTWLRVAARLGIDLTKQPATQPATQGDRT